MRAMLLAGALGLLLVQGLPAFVGATIEQMRQIYGPTRHGSQSEAGWLMPDGHVMIAKFQDGRVASLACLAPDNVRMETAMRDRVVSSWVQNAALSAPGTPGSRFGGYTIFPNDFPWVRLTGVTPAGRCIAYEVASRRLVNGTEVLEWQLIVETESYFRKVMP